MIKFISAALLGLCLFAISLPTQAIEQQQQQQQQKQQQQKTSIWVGTEDLPGYGRLEFQFNNGKVTMIDAKSTTEGTFTHDTVTHTVVCTFPGSSVYTGTIVGNTLSGTARDEHRTWNFTVTFVSEK
jgi:hypothetical protein